MIDVAKICTRPSSPAAPAGGEMTERIRGLDWSDTALGPPDGWPRDLAAATRIVLAANRPMGIWWGPELTQLYNDACAPLLGSRHPQALGQAASAAWRDQWQALGPLSDAVLRTGRAAQSGELSVSVERDGSVEELYLTFSCSPISDEAGGVGGVLVAVTEDTERVLSRRRLRTLAALAQAIREAKSASQVWTWAAASLAQNDQDLPFALLYRSDGVERVATLAGASGLAAPELAGFERIELDATDGPWPLAEVAATRRPMQIEGLPERLGSLAGGRWSDPPQRAVVLPLTTLGQPPVVGFAVAAISPRLAFTEDYRRFLELLADRIAAALVQLTGRPGADGRPDDHPPRQDLGLRHDPHALAHAVPLVDALRASEERLQRTLAQSHAIFNQMTEGLVIFDPAGYLLDMNPAALAIHGFETVVGLRRHLDTLRDTFEVFDLAGRRLPIAEWPIGRVLRGETFSAYMVRVRRVDTGKSWIGSYGGTLVHGPAGEPALAIVTLRDVTAQRKAEERLRHAHALIEGITEGTDDLIAAQDSEFRYIYFNGAYRREFQRLWGPDLGLGMSMLEALAPWPDDQRKARELWSRALNGESFSVTEEFGPSASQKQVYDLRFNPVHDAGGRLIGAAHILRNVTASVQMQAALTQSEATLKAVLDALPVGVIIADPQGAVLRDNAAHRELWGAPPETTSWEQYGQWVGFWPDGGERIQAHEWGMARALLNGEVVRGELVACERFDTGARRFFLNNAAPVRDADGRIIAGVVAELDVTERRGFEQQLEERESFYRQTLESIPGMTFTNKPDGSCDYVSEQWVEFTGVPAAQHRGDGWLQCLHPEDRPRASAAWRATVEGQGPYDLEYRVRRRDGEYEWFKVRGRAIRDSAGAVARWFGTAVNVDDLKRAEAALQEAGRRKDEFLATLAHELRNPLAPLRNGLEVLNREQDDPALLDRVRAMMGRQLDHLVRLVDDLLDVSRISRGKIDLRWERVELADVAQAAVETAGPTLEAAGHVLTVHVSPEPVHVEADPARLAQVVANLLNNAAKFTQPGGHVALTVGQEGEEATVSVQDDGIGIPSHMLSEVFNLFSQVDRSLERSQSGLGIGLTLVKQLVEMHGGRVEARSEGPNKGSEFVVRLPLALPSAPEQNDAHDTQQSRSRTASVRRVLVVDDREDAAESMAMLLKSMGNDVRTAYDGRTALEAGAVYRPDVVILDIGMPQLNGYETAKRIRREPWGERVLLVALTGWGQEGDKRRSQEAGFDHHLVKPIDLDALDALFAELG